MYGMICSLLYPFYCKCVLVKKYWLAWLIGISVSFLPMINSNSHFKPWRKVDLENKGFQERWISLFFIQCNVTASLLMCRYCRKLLFSVGIPLMNMQSSNVHKESLSSPLRREQPGQWPPGNLEGSLNCRSMSLWWWAVALRPGYFDY